MPELKGQPTGFVRDMVLRKHVSSRNILRFPEPSLTVSKDLYDGLRQHFRSVMFIIKESNLVYTLDATMFDQVKVTYDYGNGKNYRVPIRYFNAIGIQKPFI